MSVNKRDEKQVKRRKRSTRDRGREMNLSTRRVDSQQRSREEERQVRRARIKKRQTE